MNNDNWFRNTIWTDDIASQFEAKLKRARRKEQYLRIQASTLAKSHPQVAHLLLDRYFDMPDDYDHAQAYVDRAIAYLSEGKIEDAIASYEAALKREAQFPKLLTMACVDLPYLIALSGMTEHFARAVEILNAYQNRLMFAVDRFKWNAAQAYISQSVGSPTSAKSYAMAALSASQSNSSGFRYHPTVGLVQSSFSEVQSQLKTLCDSLPT
jgi:tetratricopeptide (TPR) repeat protein